MLATTMHGHLPIAGVSVNPIDFTTPIQDTSATRDTFSLVVSPDGPPIHSYFNTGVFTDAPTSVHEPWLQIGLGLVFLLPLAQTAYRATRLLGLIDPLRKLPAVAHFLPEAGRTVEAALHDMRSSETIPLFDRINSATGWWLQSYGAWFARMTVIVALPLTIQDLFQARYRLVSCALMMMALGVLTYIALRNEGQANRQYLKVASPNLKRFRLLLQSAIQPGARRQLQEFNRLVTDTVLMRRQMMGIFNYRPRRHPQPIEMRSDTGRQIA